MRSYSYEPVSIVQRPDPSNKTGQTYITAGSVTALVYDVLETEFGSWHGLNQIVAAVHRMRPDAKVGTIKRSVYRLARKGFAEHSLSPIDRRAEFRITRRQGG